MCNAKKIEVSLGAQVDVAHRHLFAGALNRAMLRVTKAIDSLSKASTSVANFRVNDGRLLGNVTALHAEIVKGLKDVVRAAARWDVDDISRTLVSLRKKVSVQSWSPCSTALINRTIGGAVSRAWG